MVDEIVRLLTPDDPALEPSERSRVQSSVTGFVASQVEGLPSFMALPYRLAISAFDLLSVVRYGRSFCSLEDSRKRAYLALWSEFPIGPPRDFVKLIRGCALLAFFDHPDVTRALLSELAAGGATHV